jgi:uncharacterized protein YjbI with pentapeptide repeats
VDQEQKPSERSLIREMVPDWRPSRKQVLWTVRIVIVLVVVLGVVTLIGLPFGITLWEWVKLLIVPAVIAGGGIWFNRQQRLRELEIAEQRAQDEALQAYLDQMSQMLTDKEQPLHRAHPGDHLSVVARARTLSALPRLDGVRKLSILQFLYESRLIAKDRIVLDLKGADLSGAEVSGASIIDVRLILADLSEADRRGRLNLSRAHLSEADLSRVNLSGADLSGANLIGADLIGADLSGANLSKARLMWADLSKAKLHRAILSEAILVWPNLSGADLSGAVGITNEKLAAQSKSLRDATMLDGQKYEEWLRDKEARGEDGENSGPS